MKGCRWWYISTVGVAGIVRGERASAVPRGRVGCMVASLSTSVDRSLAIALEGEAAAGGNARGGGVGRGTVWLTGLQVMGGGGLRRSRG